MLIILDGLFRGFDFIQSVLIPQYVSVTNSQMGAHKNAKFETIDGGVGATEAPPRHKGIIPDGCPGDNVPKPMYLSHSKGALTLIISSL